jgi:hypothetical protein
MRLPMLSALIGRPKLALPEPAAELLQRCRLPRPDRGSLYEDDLLRVDLVRVCEPDDHLHEAAPQSIGRDQVDERLRQLQVVERQLAEVAER